VSEAVAAALGEPCRVTCRLTHVYPDGPAPYFTVLAPARRGDEVAQWHEMKAAAGRAILDAGGTITHHHGVGRDHRPWYDTQRPDAFAAALRAAKGALDPAGLLNPGVLIDPQQVCQGGGRSGLDARLHLEPESARPTVAERRLVAAERLGHLTAIRRPRAGGIRAETLAAAMRAGGRFCRARARHAQEVEAVAGGETARQGVHASASHSCEASRRANGVAAVALRQVQREEDVGHESCRPAPQRAPALCDGRPRPWAGRGTAADRGLVRPDVPRQ
jgi:hypothetical protein